MRRYAELQKRGVKADYEQVLADLHKRDEQDMNRTVDPLRAAEDAVVVDTTHMTFDESVEAILRVVEAKKNA